MAYKSKIIPGMMVTGIEYVILSVKEGSINVNEGVTQISKILSKRQMTSNKWMESIPLSQRIEELATVIRHYTPNFGEVVFQHMIDYVENIDFECINNKGTLLGYLMNQGTSFLPPKAIEKFMQMIVDAGADVNRECADGYTALTFLLTDQKYAEDFGRNRYATTKMLRIILHAGGELTKNVITKLRRHGMNTGDIRTDFKTILLETLDENEILLSMLRDPFMGDDDDDDYDEDDDYEDDDYEDDIDDDVYEDDSDYDHEVDE